MSQDRQRVSVKSMVGAFESRCEPQRCGCCVHPDPRGAHRQRGCTSPVPSRDSSPARTRPREAPKGHQQKVNVWKEEVDRTLVSLLVLHR